MRKIAVFVEGQSELVAVRSLLLQKFSYEINFTCLRLYQKGQFGSCPYNWQHHNSNIHYYIYNVGSDNGVINEILSYENNLWEQGFEKIIGLRDMYSSKYKEESTTINLKTNEQFIEGNKKTIQKKAKQPQKIFFRFSIMETEAWIMGMRELFQKVNPTLTTQYINEQLGYNLCEIDPETHFYKAADNLAEIFRLMGRTYDKRLGDIELLYKHADMQDFKNLYDRSICGSYNDFLDALI